MSVSFGSFDADAFREFGLGIAAVAVGLLASAVVAVLLVVVAGRDQDGRGDKTDTYSR